MRVRLGTWIPHIWRPPKKQAKTVGHSMIHIVLISFAHSGGPKRPFPVFLNSSAKDQDPTRPGLIASVHRYFPSCTHACTLRLLSSPRRLTCMCIMTSFPPRPLGYSTRPTYRTKTWPLVDKLQRKFEEKRPLSAAHLELRGREHLAGGVVGQGPRTDIIKNKDRPIVEHSRLHSTLQRTHPKTVMSLGTQLGHNLRCHTDLLPLGQ